MRGGFLHNQVLLDPVEDLLRQLGTTTHREYAVRVAGSIGFIDLVAEFDQHKIACEAELTPDRIAADLRKAEACEATLLLILVPHRRIAQRVQRALDQAEGTRPPGGVWVLPLGPAMARLRNCFPSPTHWKGGGKKTTEGDG